MNKIITLLEDEILVDLNLVDQAQKGVKDYIKSQKFDGYGTYSTRDTYEVLHLPQIIEEAEKYISRGRTLYFKDGYTLDNEGLHPPVEGKAPITPFYWDTLPHDTI